MHVWALSGCHVKPRRPHQTGPPGLAHDSPRTPHVHISGPRRFKHHQNSTKGPQERERRKKIVAGRGKKTREILGPPPFWAPPFWAPPFWAPPFWAPPFWAPPFGAPTLRAPTLRGPTFSRFGAPPSSGPTFCRLVPPPFVGLHPSGPHPLSSKIQHPKIRNWPKSKLAEVEIGRSRNWPKSKLAEIEIGRSRNWPKSNWPNSKKKAGRSRNWPKSKLAEVEIGRSRIGRTRKKELAEVVIGRSRSRSIDRPVSPADTVDH